MNKKRIGLAACVTAMTILLATILGINPTASTSNATELVGTWERFARQDDDGKPIEERAVQSFLIFGADGHYSQITIPAGREKLRKPLQEMTKEELLNRFVGVSAEYGSYTLTGNLLTRKRLALTNPNEEGKDFVQGVRFEGDNLVLSFTTPGSKAEGKFRRAK